MMQTLAIFKDAYRELNSKKLFWIVLSISLAVVLALALPKNDAKGISVFGASADFPLLATAHVSRAGFYKFLFSWFGVNLWLAWGATILALISTASMIPDMISGGSVELVLAKPIGRLRLFLTKYAAGLLFVALQALVFSLGAIVVIGVRAGTWELRPLMAVPLVLAFFSFLFCLCVLIGVLTRSTLMALLGTVVFWLLLWALGTVEGVLLDQRLQRERTVSRLESQAEVCRTTIATIDEQVRLLQAEAPPEQERTDTGPAQPDAPAQTPPTEARPDAAPVPVAEPHRPSRPRENRSAVRHLLDAGTRVIESAKSGGDAAALQQRRQSVQRQLDELESQLPASRESAASMAKWHSRLYWARAPLPKTAETKRLFQRYVVDKKDQEGFLAVLEEMSGDPGGSEAEASLNRRPLWWVLGTSLAFEGVLVGLSAWVFCRRDF